MAMEGSRARYLAVWRCGRYSLDVSFHYSLTHTVNMDREPTYPGLRTGLTKGGKWVFPVLWEHAVGTDCLGGFEGR